MVKIIHYIWLGNKPKSNLIKKCIASWQRYMPEWRIMEWNETNLDINTNKYVAEAYKQGKYAFASDYFRFDIIERFGGLYLDTDVEIIKSFEDLLEDKNVVMGFEFNGETINPGLIMFAKMPLHPFMKKMRDSYEERVFTTGNNGLPTTICKYTSDLLVEYGAIMNDQYQQVRDITLYPSTYFCPTNKEWSVQKFSSETRCIHHYGASWLGNGNLLLNLKKLLFKTIGNKGIFILKKIRKKIYGY